ncbi:tRNA (mo5U34)-methyltransferase [Mannheimia haemolytica]|uniref:tRNA (Mo5U34)-methyltransferase n=1 Tax=Mannheimia haemolytica TaxID=75985 RepID=A0A378N8K4_MANHA|nr:tRNA (mo5U34)-methyltransferase [Mannheimia haemolytica]
MSAAVAVIICGRMVGEGAKMVVGIDPTELFLCQFEAVRKLLGNDRRANLIPLGIEQMQPLAAFDTVFSMGCFIIANHRLIIFLNSKPN